MTEKETIQLAYGLLWHLPYTRDPLTRKAKKVLREALTQEEIKPGLDKARSMLINGEIDGLDADTYFDGLENQIMRL